jgi:glycine C-acetyltransferase
MTKYAFMEEELSALKAEKRLIGIRVMQSPADAWMVVDGKRVLNFCTNNYLGLANHPTSRRPPRRPSRNGGWAQVQCAPLPEHKAST